MPDSYNATNCVVVEAHTKIKCDFVEGAGKLHQWTVRVGMQESLTPTSSYHAPIISSITGEGSFQAKTNGGQRVILNGLNFGSYPDGAVVTYGVTGLEYEPATCTVENHMKILCITSPGFGEKLFWRVSIRGQSNELVETSSYAKPMIHDISPKLSADGSGQWHSCFFECQHGFGRSLQK